MYLTPDSAAKSEASSEKEETCQRQLGKQVEQLQHLSTGTTKFHIYS